MTMCMSMTRLEAEALETLDAKLADWGDRDTTIATIATKVTTLMQIFSVTTVFGQAQATPREH